MEKIKFNCSTNHQYKLLQIRTRSHKITLTYCWFHIAVKNNFNKKTF
jgi:hypothetical protein